MQRIGKRFGASLVLGSLLILLALQPQAASAAPSCPVVKDNGDLERAAKEILGLEHPASEVGSHEVKEAFRYPLFSLRVQARNASAATLTVGARRFRAPAGLYGAPVVQMAQYSNAALRNGCQGVLKLMPVQRSRRCWPAYTQNGPGYQCQTRWWPKRRPDCQSSSEGFTCEWIERRFTLGEPVRVHIPQGARVGVKAYVSIPDFILPGQCICVSDTTLEPHSGWTNELLLR